MENYLSHHGIKGQKWGVRRFQNKDGSLTSAGRKRYSKEDKENFKKIRKERGKVRDSINYDYNDEYYRKIDYKPIVSDSETNEIVKQMKKLYDRQKYLLDHYNFDGDDGGGGVTEADQKAGKEYAKIWFEDLYDLEYQLDQKASKLADNYVKEKYGEKTVKEMDEYFTKQANKKAAIFVSGLFALPVITLAVTLKDAFN